ncbi:hypothetical protein [Methylobacterium brachiatum]|uniref:hypothetical protein n=1 Tax=Methylobacterium brachiatum TaxID=269660 RepID=UPI0024485570|nr:hypothetical protein [Methylobacterium brachiatum]MDH2313174.1 hypothetical protein [Methylobacterium brachiatum]
MDERITSLEVRVGGIEDGIKTIVGKLDSRDRIPWGVIGTFAALVLSVIASIGGLAFRPLGDGIADLKVALVKMENRADRYVPREDLDNRFAVISQRRDDLQRLTDARVERIERDLDTTVKQIVPRGEHEQMWAGQRARDADLQRQADQNRQGLYDLNTPRDTIQGMQKRIDELERDARVPARR